MNSVIIKAKVEQDDEPTSEKDEPEQYDKIDLVKLISFSDRDIIREPEGFKLREMGKRIKNEEPFEEINMSMSDIYRKSSEDLLS